MFRTENFFLCSFCICISVRIIEKTKIVFCVKNSSCCICNGLFGHFSFRNGLFQSFQKAFSNHIHIDSGVHCQSGNLFQISHSVVDHFIDSSIICHHKAFEIPFFSQNICHQPFVSSCRNSINLIERRHHRSCTSIHSRFVRWEEHIVHLNVTHINCVVISTCFSCAIKCEMFHASQHRIFLGQVISLITINHSFCNLASQIRIFTRTFGNPSPSWISGNIYHW